MIAMRPLESTKAKIKGKWSVSQSMNMRRIVKMYMAEEEKTLRGKSPSCER